jgi:hypothetical protein
MARTTKTTTVTTMTTTTTTMMAAYDVPYVVPYGMYSRGWQRRGGNQQ